MVFAYFITVGTSFIKYLRGLWYFFEKSGKNYPTILRFIIRIKMETYIRLKRLIYVLTKLCFKLEEYVQHTSTGLITYVCLVKLLIKFFLLYMKKPFHCINISNLCSLFYIFSLVNNTYLVLHREKTTLIY